MRRAGLPRTVEVLAAAGGLVLLAPVLIVLSVLVFLGDPGLVFFRQVRVGRDGRPFRLVKFRTMRTASATGPAVTIGADPRITRVGQALRRHKLDELPQLFNVLAGQMSLVGPRPELPEFIRWELPQQREILAVRPGLVDPASLAFRREADLLAAQPDPLAFYRDELVPEKLRCSQLYLRRRSWRSDLTTIGLALAQVAHG